MDAAASRVAAGEDFSTAELCAATGVTNGSFFHAFPTKDAVVVALFAEALADYQRAIAARVLRSASARAGIEGIVLEHVRWVTRNPSGARILHELRRGPSEQAVSAAVAEPNARFREQMNGWLGDHVRARRIRALPAGAVMPIVFGPVQLATRDWLRTGGAPAVLRAIAPELARAAWVALER